MIRWFPLILACLCCLPGVTRAAAFGAYERVEFAPARGQSFAIPFHLEQPATVRVALLTSDGDPVRTLHAPEALPAGNHTLTWDGKDEEGTVVPDEAYIPVLTARHADGTEQVVDPRAAGGGEIVEELHVGVTPNRDIAYTLPAPSRVLIRAGIKDGGPMLRALANWEPRGPGRNVQRWDGRDQSGVIDIRDEASLGVLVSAFRLPEHALITTGNTATGYRAYRQHKGWPDRLVPPEKRVLSRGTARIASQYYQPCDQYAEPRVSLSLPGDLPRSAAGLPQLRPGQPVAVRADMAKEDRWLMDEDLYEVAFYVDHGFIAEEEQGYVPLTWRWSVPEDLEPGRHLITVNIIGSGGKIGVANALFHVTGKKETP